MVVKIVLKIIVIALPCASSVSIFGIFMKDEMVKIEEKLCRVKDTMFYFGVCRTNVNNGGN